MTYSAEQTREHLAQLRQRLVEDGWQQTDDPTRMVMPETDLAVETGYVYGEITARLSVNTVRRNGRWILLSRGNGPGWVSHIARVVGRAVQVHVDEHSEREFWGENL